MTTVPTGSIDLIPTSPPYNTRKDYGVFFDEMPWSGWYQFIGLFAKEAHRILRPGGVLALNVLKEARWQRDHAFASTWVDYDANYLTHRGHVRNVKGKARVEPVFNKVYELMKSAGFKMRESIVWVKGSLNEDHEISTISTNYQMGCDSDPYLRGTAEMIVLGSKERWYHDGGSGRRGGSDMPFDLETKDVWVVPSTTNGDHPASFPEEIPARLIRLFVHRKNTRNLPTPIIADFFMGRGTTAIAAIKMGYNFLGCDINPDYVKLANERIEKTRLELAQLELSL